MLSNTKNLMMKSSGALKLPLKSQLSDKFVSDTRQSFPSIQSPTQVQIMSPKGLVHYAVTSTDTQRQAQQIISTRQSIVQGQKSSVKGMSCRSGGGGGPGTNTGVASMSFLSKRN